MSLILFLVIWQIAISLACDDICSPILWTVPLDAGLYESYAERMSNINPNMANKQSFKWPECYAVNGTNTNCYVLTHDSEKVVCACPCISYTALPIMVRNSSFVPTFIGEDYLDGCKRVLIPAAYDITNCSISISEKIRFEYDYSVEIATSLNGTWSKDLSCTDLTTEEIIGIICGSVIGFIIFVLCVYFVCKWCKGDGTYPSHGL